jgi:ParB/RepB/Spo0J family partition protein
MHDRLGDGIDIDSCKSLLDSMEKHGQKSAVLGRPLVNDPDYEVELIYGARRLFVAQQLGIDLSVEVRVIDDREALVEMDIENRVRADISPYERGLSYRRWLRSGHFANQAEIAKCLGVSEAQVSRLLRYSELPAAIVNAFASSRDIREEWAVELAKRCRDEEFREGMLRRARDCRSTERQLSPQHVYDVLVNNGVRKPVNAGSRDEVVKNESGEVVARIAFRAKSVHFIVARDRVTKPVLQDLKQLLAKYFATSATTSTNVSKLPRAPRIQPAECDTVHAAAMRFATLRRSVSTGDGAA